MIKALRKRVLASVFQCLLTVTAALLVFYLPDAQATVIGPTDPSVLPGGAPFTSLGGATAYGRAGGQTWSFGAITYAAQTTVWHGAVQNAVEFTMSGPSFANPGEVM